jgi:hypothetical protein
MLLIGTVEDSPKIDNLPAHKVAGVREAIEARGATLRYRRPQRHRPRSR